ncbi:metallophosphoesterase family protein [Rhizobium helianthi]|uniref:Metallophosphoesterase family protein n=1 Tax=Rhizobium helianthi TaxID=1132695 RepID=A0ABW4M4B3_9HYPH
MVKLLACSDIHNNVKAVRKLGSLETNDFDAVIVAGDIESQNADEVFEVLRTFDCPVLYVYGNWDNRLEYRQDFGERCHHVHLSPFDLNGLSVVGETVDGIDLEWEARRQNSSASDSAAIEADHSLYFQQQRAKLSAIVAAGNPERTIVMSHYRLTKTQGHLPSVPLFLFGQIHKFEDVTYRGQRFINVSALDKKVMVAKKGQRAGPKNWRYINDGSYVIITHNERTGFSVEPRRFDPDFFEWERIEGIVHSSAPEVE